MFRDIAHQTSISSRQNSGTDLQNEPVDFYGPTIVQAIKDNSTPEISKQSKYSILSDKIHKD